MAAVTVADQMDQFSGMHTQKIVDELSPPEFFDVPEVMEKPKGRIKQLYERGMATAEYAVGILAAVAFALVLLRIFTNNDFFEKMLKFVLQLIDKVGGQLP